MEWLEDHKIPIGQYLANFVDLLNDYMFWFFDGFTQSAEFLVEWSAAGLLWLNPFVFIVIVSGISYALHRSWKQTLFVVLALMLVINLGYWEATMDTLALVLWATLMCMVIGVPIGIAAAHRPRLWTFMRPVLDMMQTIPTFVYLIPALVLFGLGPAPGLVATIIFVVPAPIRLSYLGVSSVPKQLVEAAESFGATNSQLLWKVEIPHAMPTIMAGLTQTIMLTLSMVVIASMVAAPGLGVEILRSINQVNVSKGLDAGLVLALVAIILDRICKQPGKKDGE